MKINFNYLIQALIAVVIVGVFLNLRSVTKIFGGVVGAAVRMFGLGTLFVALGIIERILVDLQIVLPSTTLTLVQLIFDLLGIAFLGWGFKKLASGMKI